MIPLDDKQRIVWTSEGVATYKEAYLQALADAHNNGATWEELGELVGTSKQAVSQLVKQWEARRAPH